MTVRRSALEQKSFSSLCEVVAFFLASERGTGGIDTTYASNARLSPLLFVFTLPIHRRAASRGVKPGVDKKTKTIGQYEILKKKLGEGTFGKVKMGRHQLSKEGVAIKVLERSRIKEEADVKRVSREIKILRRIRHDNIVQLYEVIYTRSQIYLIMEYANGEACARERGRASACQLAQSYSSLTRTCSRRWRDI